MDFEHVKRVHLIGIDGISISAIAKLLLAQGIEVSGSELYENDQTRDLASRGVRVFSSESASNIPESCDLVIYTVARPADNIERAEARRRGIPEMTNSEFLGAWTKDKKVILVAGTHGKSTTTAMLGQILIDADIDPTVIVGSRVPTFPDGNIRLGSSPLYIIEGDEYAKHFLDFRPHGVIINNIEGDHFDVYPTVDAMVDVFRTLLSQIKDGGVLLVNRDSAHAHSLAKELKKDLASRHVSSYDFSVDDSVVSEITMQVPGLVNRKNAAAAAAMAELLGAPVDTIKKTLAAFTGIWRRFEFVKEVNGAKIFSDYGHHPTAVRETLAAAHEAYPGQRIVLCFQPHHRNRTKHLFFEFETCFDEADEVILCEIYDVKGRELAEDANISSKDLYDVVVRRFADMQTGKHVEFAEDPEKAIARTKALMKEGDIVIVMGAGDIDATLRKNV